MADVDVDELKKLTPEQRLKALKALEEKSKKEIEEARKLMAESEREIEVKEEHQRDMPIPQLTSVDIDSLFSPEEKEIFKAKRYVSEPKTFEEVSTEKKSEPGDMLEEVVQKEKQFEIEQQQGQYGQKLEQIHDRVYQLQEMAETDPARFMKYENDYKEELAMMKNDFENIQQKYKTAGDTVAELSTMGNQIDKLLGWYKQ